MLNGELRFESNNIDQSDNFLRHVVLAMMSDHIEGFALTSDAIDDVEFGQTYEFEADNASDIETYIHFENGMDELIKKSPKIKKTYPKAQFNNLRLIITHDEMNGEEIDAIIKYDELEDRLTTILDITEGPELVKEG